MAFRSARDIDLVAHSLYASTILESAAGTGVTADGVKLQDGGITCTGNIAMGVGGTVDGVDLSAIPTTYLPLAGGTMSGGLNMGAQAISNCGGITMSGASTVDGVDVSAIPSTYLALSGGTMAGAIAMGAQELTNCGNITMNTTCTVDGVDVSTIPTTYLPLAGGTMAGNLVMGTGNLLIGGNGIGNDAAVLTFSTTTTGEATFGGSLRSSGGSFYLGVAHTTQATMYLYSPGTGAGGPTIYMHTSGAYDDVIDYYQVDVNEDDWRISSASGVKLTLQGSDGTWLFGAAVGMGANTLTNCGNITMNGTSTVDGVDVSAIPTTYLALAGGTMAGAIAMGSNAITGASNVYVNTTGIMGISGAASWTFVSGTTQINITSADLMMGAAQRIYFEAGGTVKDTEFIYSAGNGYLDYGAATGHRFAGAVTMNTSLTIGTTAIVEEVAATTLKIAGEVEIGQWPASAGYAMFGNSDLNQAASGNYALLQKADGYTYLNCASGTGIYLRVNNTTVVTVLSTAMKLATTGQLQFNDTGTYWYSRANSVLTGVADGSIELNAPAVYVGVTAGDNAVMGNLAALATNATNGFLYIPTCAGVPTGVPTAYTGKVPLVYDTTNNDLYVYNAAWKKIPHAYA